MHTKKKTTPKRKAFAELINKGFLHLLSFKPVKHGLLKALNK